MGQPMKEVFWLPVDSKWFKIAEQLKVSDAQYISSRTGQLDDKHIFVHGKSQPTNCKIAAGQT